MQELHDQLEKIIEAKKKQAKSASESVEFGQTQPSAIVNLEEIKKAVFQAIGRMEQIYKEATELLQRPHIKPGVSKTAATIGTTEDQDEDS